MYPFKGSSYRKATTIILTTALLTSLSKIGRIYDTAADEETSETLILS